MLTTEQKASLHRVQGQEGLLSALFNEVAESLTKEITSSEPHEAKKREDLYTKITLISTIDSLLKTTIQSYKNSL